LKVLLWDIDGTLLRTDKAGLYAFRQAALEMYQVECSFGEIVAAGMTDYYIAAQIIMNITGDSPGVDEVTALVRRYEQLLPYHLACRKGFLIPPVVEILRYISAREDYVSLLLTGNTAVGAKIKLSYYNVAGYFDFSGSAFGDSRLRRREVAAQALSKVRLCYPDVLADDIFVIGDTPQDIICGKGIGARTVAVATGTYSLFELMAYSPWWGVDVLPPPAEFSAKLNTNLC